MKYKVADKEKAVNAMCEQAKKSNAVYLINALGLTVEESTELRRRLREADVYMKVQKNTLLSRAFANAGITGLDDYLVGPTAVVVAGADEVAPARIITEFAKKQVKKLPAFKSAVVEGKVISESQIVVLSTLPNKKQLLGMLASALNQPTTKLAAVMQALTTQIAYAVQAVKEHKEKQE